MPDGPLRLPVIRRPQASGRTDDAQARWTDKRERQYEHIKESLLERGKGAKTAEEIAARTVNKDRAQHGESVTASRTSLDDISPERRGGLRSHRGEGGRTHAQLYAEAAKEERSRAARR